MDQRLWYKNGFINSDNKVRLLGGEKMKYYEYAKNDINKWEKLIGFKVCNYNKKDKYTKG